MNQISLFAGCLLLFTIFFYLINLLLTLWLGKRQLRGRLTPHSTHQWYQMLIVRSKRFNTFREHIALLLETLRMYRKPDLFLMISLVLFVFGVVVGGLFFQSMKGVVLFGVTTGLLPYVYLRAMLVHRRMQAQMDFLPAVELFYQCYMVTGERHVKVALQRAVEENRLLGPMQSVFEQLYRNLAIRGDDEASLRLLASSLGHTWADYFVNMLHVSLSEGVSISENLRELLSDMRKARRANELERHRLLEIRVANFSPVLFLVLFVGINMRYNAENSYIYYVQSAQGRDLLLNALILIFISFLMGLWLSRRKM